MTDEEIAALVRGDESDRVERKESLSDRVRKAICSFANDLAGHRRPGLVVIGQRDDGSCVNLTINDQLLATLAGIRVESAFAPFPAIDVKRMTIDGCDVAVVVVHPSSSPPVRYDGRIWVRVGPTTRIATPEEEQRLSERRRASHLPFDVQAVAATSSRKTIAGRNSSSRPSGSSPPMENRPSWGSSCWRVTRCGSSQARTSSSCVSMARSYPPRHREQAPCR
ncbi:MAG: ATP-binding protein [Deltaproteobacteria bacterium]|nr:MAG: ATP-binding protein [Deltaproteobacteria bacterium]